MMGNEVSTVQKPSKFRNNKNLRFRLFFAQLYEPFLHFYPSPPLPCFLIPFPFLLSFPSFFPPISFSFSFLTATFVSFFLSSSFSPLSCPSHFLLSPSPFSPFIFLPPFPFFPVPFFSLSFLPLSFSLTSPSLTSPSFSTLCLPFLLFHPFPFSSSTSFPSVAKYTTIYRVWWLT